MCGYRIPCTEKHNKILQAENKLHQIKRECIYAKEDIEDYELYIGCKKDGHAYHLPGCKPSLECEKFVRCEKCENEEGDIND
jgi:hypothetical protein